MSKLHIIWDLDGTLINSEQEVLNAIIKSVHDVGLKESDQKAAFRVGPTIDKILDNAFSSTILTTDIKNKIIKTFRMNYDNCGFNNTPAFSGIEDILKNKNYIHHIITNKPDLATNRIIEKLKWNNYFDSIITPYSFLKSENDKRKNKTELFKICIDTYPNERFIGIGDMETDANAALACEIPAIGVLWGTGTKKELQNCSCSYIVDSVMNLKKLLETI